MQILYEQIVDFSTVDDEVVRNSHDNLSLSVHGGFIGQRRLSESYPGSFGIWHVGFKTMHKFARITRRKKLNNNLS